MATLEMLQSDILRLEAEMNNLWGELNTSNIPYAMRMEFESTLAGCEEAFKAVLGGQTSPKKLDKTLQTVNLALAESVVQQAENEIPKAKHSSSAFQALENIRKELAAGSITPAYARHEVKEIMRHFS